CRSRFVDGSAVASGVETGRGFLGYSSGRRHAGAVFFFSSRRRHTIWPRDWSSDVCSSDLLRHLVGRAGQSDEAGVLRGAGISGRSEERRVGKECRSQRSEERHKKKEMTERRKESSDVNINCIGGVATSVSTTLYGYPHAHR